MKNLYSILVFATIFNISNLYGGRCTGPNPYQTARNAANSRKCSGSVSTPPTATTTTATTTTAPTKKPLTETQQMYKDAYENAKKVYEDQKKISPNDSNLPYFKSVMDHFEIGYNESMQ